MNAKNIILTVVGVIAVFALVSLSTMGGLRGKHCYKKPGLGGKICQKAGFLMKNQKAIGLTDGQVKAIKSVASASKKRSIKQKAEIQLIKVDIKSKLHEDKINTKAINKLIDKKYAVKKQKAKDLVQAYATMKSVLTDEQLQKAKSIYGSKKCIKCCKPKISKKCRK